MEHTKQPTLANLYIYIYIFIFIHQKTVEKKNNTRTIKSERKANNLTKQKTFPNTIDNIF